MVGAVFAATITMNALNLSSVTVLWMIFGQMKLWQILLLQDGYISEYARKYIIGFKFTLFSFSFMDFKSNVFEALIGAKSIVSYLDFDQENSTMNDLGIDFGNAIYRIWVWECICE